VNFRFFLIAPRGGGIVHGKKPEVYNLATLSLYFAVTFTVIFLWWVGKGKEI
jgi:hypothetical protein